MVALTNTLAFLGLEARAVEVQCQIARGLPRFGIVGLADKAVAESRERVQSALTAMGLALPPKRITINLSPADLPKEGSHYDLPIALALLAAMGVTDAEQLQDWVAVGELSLDGRIQPSPGVLLAALHAAEKEVGLICPQSQGSEARWAQGVPICAAPDLLSLLNHLKGTQILPDPQPGNIEEGAPGPNLKQVKGQESAKRALEIAAAGGHNMLMNGPPGAGKSLLASCLPSILPPLSAEEALEVSMVQSIAGLLDGGQISRERPFRAPHHSASIAALTGGGLKVKPGEVSLAHLGVLFLDELPEFQRPALDSLRQPLESGKVDIARANAHVTFPARVQLIAAMNPCRCGHLSDPALACARAPRCAADYQNKISGPLLDRIDLHLDIEPVMAKDLTNPPPAETSAQIAQRVARARSLQTQRMVQFEEEKEAKKNQHRGNNVRDIRSASGFNVKTRKNVAARARKENLIRCNAELTGEALEVLARPDQAGQRLLTEAAEALRLSARGYVRVQRVARTIADLGGVETVGRVHIAEALSYRRQPARA